MSHNASNIIKLFVVAAAESQSSISSETSSEWSLDKESREVRELQGKPVMADTEKQNDEGYTKLEVTY